MAKYNFKDLTGKVFTYLTVDRLNREKSDEMGCLYWDCTCKCGNKVTVAGYSLKRGHTKSCGCYSREMVIKKNIEARKSNRIEFDENLGCYRGYFNTTDGSFLFDVQDLDVVQQHCWYKSSSGYAEAVQRNDPKHTHIKMHRVIMAKYEDIEGKDVDHISLNVLDNRSSCNLRVVPHEKNMRNRRPYSNTGEQYISYTCGRYCLGLPNDYNNTYKTLEEAKAVRDEFLMNNPDEYRYNPNLDYKNRENAIHPFRFIDPNSIIQPFKFIDPDSIIKPFIEVDKDSYKK